MEAKFFTHKNKIFAKSIIFPPLESFKATKTENKTGGKYTKERWSGTFFYIGNFLSLTILFCWWSLLNCLLPYGNAKSEISPLAHSFDIYYVPLICYDSNMCVYVCTICSMKTAAATVAKFRMLFMYVSWSWE